jgi:hypothetical protein
VGVLNDGPLVESHGSRNGLLFRSIRLGKSPDLQEASRENEFDTGSKPGLSHQQNAQGKMQQSDVDVPKRDNLPSAGFSTVTMYFLWLYFSATRDRCSNVGAFGDIE